MIKKKIVRPDPKGSALLWDPKWAYVPAVKTDILARFKAMNWTPPSSKENHS